MTTSRARLVAAAVQGETRAFSAPAASPQRWTFSRPSVRWLEAIHQLIGDGVFGGDLHRTSVTVHAGARLLIRSVSATSLRSCGPSGTIWRIRVESGATLILLPGALIPHAGSDHITSLHIEASSSSRVFVATILTPGRTGSGERWGFRRLRMRTNAMVSPSPAAVGEEARGRGKSLAFAEDVLIEPGRFDLDSPAAFAGAGASLSVLALGDWSLATPEWWRFAEDTPAVVAGASRLRLGGVAFRALCATLGQSQQLLAVIEERARGDSTPAIP